MEKEVSFTMKEMKRYSLIQALLEKKMTSKKAALALNVSTRHIKRTKKKVKQRGALEVLHGNKERPPFAAGILARLPGKVFPRGIHRTRLHTTVTTICWMTDPTCSTGFVNSLASVRTTMSLTGGPNSGIIGILNLPYRTYSHLW